MAGVETEATLLSDKYGSYWRRVVKALERYVETRHDDVDVTDLLEDMLKLNDPEEDMPSVLRHYEFLDKMDLLQGFELAGRFHEKTVQLQLKLRKGGVA